MTAMSSAQQSEVKAWEEEIIACEHALTLQQEPLIVPGEGWLTRVPIADMTSPITLPGV